jgi:hypothetical protein
MPGVCWNILPQISQINAELLLMKSMHIREVPPIGVNFPSMSSALICESAATIPANSYRLQKAAWIFDYALSRTDLNQSRQS